MTRAARRCKHATCGGAEGREGQRKARRGDTNREKRFTRRDPSDSKRRRLRGGEIKTRCHPELLSPRACRASVLLLPLVAHTGLSKCHVLLHISRTPTTARERQAGAQRGDSTPYVGHRVAELQQRRESSSIRTLHMSFSFRRSFTAE